MILIWQSLSQGQGDYGVLPLKVRSILNVATLIQNTKTKKMLSSNICFLCVSLVNKSMVFKLAYCPYFSQKKAVLLYLPIFFFSKLCFFFSSVNIISDFASILIISEHKNIHVAVFIFFKIFF